MAHVHIDGRRFFLLSPANQSFLTGTASQPTIDSGRRYSHWGLWILAGVLFLLAGNMFGDVVDTWRLRHRLQIDGVQTLGTVVDLRKVVNDDSTKYYVRYRFDATTADGVRTFTHEPQVHPETFRSLQVGALLTIFYSASDPRLSKVSHALPDEPWRDTAIVAGSLIAAIALGLWAGILRVRMQQLLAHGQVLTGILHEAKGRFDGDGDYMVDLRYAFRTPDGATIQGRHHAVAPEMRDGVLPDVGTTVAVLFVSEKNYLLL